MTTQDRTDRARWDVQLGTDPVLTTTLSPSQIQHRRLDVDRGAPGLAMGPRRTVKQTHGPFSAESVHPPVRALPRHLELLRDVGDRATVIDHPRDEQTTTMNSQTSINVGHEDLLGEW